MKNNIVINISSGDTRVNNGFTGHADSLSCKDISIKIGKKLEVTRECFSQTPLFYAVIDDCFYASTRCGDLLSLLQDYKPLLNLDYVYEYIQFQCPYTAATIYDGIYCLRNGETITIGAKEEVSTHFTTPAHSPGTPLEKTLNDSLAKLNIAETVFHISSGLDSSILALLAAKIHSSPLQLVTCSTRGKGTADELDNVRRLAGELGADLTVYDFENINIFEEGAALVKALDYPVGHPSHLVEFLLDAECKDKTCVVTGRGPDETLAGYQWHREEYSSPEKHFDRVCVTKPEILNKLLPGSPGSARSADEFHAPGRQDLTLRDRLLYDLRSISEAWDIIHTGIAGYFSIDIESPFMDKKLRKTFFLLADDLKIRNGIHKWYLRESFKDLYPGYILDSPKQGLRLDLQPYLKEYGFSELFDLLYTSSDFSQRYIDKMFLKEMLNDTLDCKRNWGWQIWNIYLCSLFFSNFEFSMR